MSFKTTNVGSISEEMYYYIQGLLPEGSTILEFGSGEGTRELARQYKMISIEHDYNWVGEYDSKYYYAPLVDGWYDVTVVSAAATEDFDLLLIDGPPAHHPRIEKARKGFWKNIDLFRPYIDNKPIIVDDVQRPNDAANLVLIAKTLKREFELVDCADGKQFGVIL